ncbi:MAG: tyrosine-type recombinase/integrase [Thermoplasmatota archaeon]
MEETPRQPVVYPNETPSPPKPRESTPAALRKRGPKVEEKTDRLVAQASTANRPFIEAGVVALRAKGLRSVSTALWARALCRLDGVVTGAPFASLTAADLATAVATLRREHGWSPRTVRQFTTYAKAAWRDLLNTDHLPRDIKRALSTLPPHDDVGEARVVSDEQFHALLRAAAGHTKCRDGLPACITYSALLWTLWDSGFRADEMLSLNVGDVTLFPNGTAKLRLRPEAPELGHGEHKTGARIVNVGECVPALNALLAMHPRGQDRDAPLFPNPFRRSTEDRLRYLNLSRILTRLADQTGLNEVRGPSNHLSAHDFRHTCATRKARMGWTDNDLRKHFGWGQSSRMPAYYVHLRDMDLMERVRRDLGITAEGFSNVVIWPRPAKRNRSTRGKRQWGDQL